MAQENPNRLELIGRLDYLPPLFTVGKPVIVVGGKELIEAIRDKWSIRGPNNLGRCRITIERLEDE